MSYNTDSADVLRRRNEPPPPYSERDEYNTNNGQNSRDRTSNASRAKVDEHIAYQIFASFPYFVQSAISLSKAIAMWLFYKGLFGLLLLTPIGPIWLLYQKGLDIISYIPIAIQFAKDMGAIGRKCYDDAMNKTGYIDSKDLKRDLRAALLRLLGYEYQKPEELQEEMVADDDDGGAASLPQSTSKERFRDSAVYTLTFGNFPTYLTKRGLVPPNRELHRTRQANKSRVASFVLCCVGMAYYIVSGKFLFKNVHAIEKLEKDKMDAKKNSDASSNGETQRKFNWKWIYAIIIISFGFWWLFASHTEPGVTTYTSMIITAITSPFTFFIGNSYHIIMWTWSKFFDICFWFPRLIFGMGTSETQTNPSQNDYAYAKKNH